MRACPVRREERQTTGKRYTWGIARGVTAWMDQHLADDVVARRRQQQVGRRLPGQATARPPRSGGWRERRRRRPVPGRPARL